MFCDFAPKTGRPEFWAGMGRVVRCAFVAFAVMPVMRIYETAGSVTTDKWTHLVVTISLSKDQMQFFVDGRLTKTWDTEGKPALAGSAWNIPADEDHVIYIGTSSSYTPGDSEVTPETWEANESFNGAIDNLKIYDVALSAGQVSKLYSDELGE